MRRPNRLVLAGLLAGSSLCCLTLSLQAGNWPQWRGPYFNGSAEEKGLPVQWSKTENIAWVAPLPGYSGATPVVWGDSVFVSSPDAQKNLLLICLNRLDGKVRWQKVVSVGDKEKGRNNMTAPSPATDGKNVFVMFGNGDLAAYDFAGNQQWIRHLGMEYGRIANMWLYGSSPLLYQGRLYVQVLQRNPPPPDYPSVDDKPTRESFLLCVDPQTGKNLWRQVRPTDAYMESQEAYSSPIPHEVNGHSEIVVLGGDYTTGHDPLTGAELWRCGGLNPRISTTQKQWYRIVPSPVVSPDFIYVSGPKREPLIAIKAGGTGTITDSHIAWSFKEYPTDCVTPLYYQNKLFVLDGDKQMLTCLDHKTGEKKWQGNLGTREIFRGSPTGADGKIYCLTERGTVVIVEAGDDFKILATIPLNEEPCRSAIAVSDGQLFIRTGQNLYCVGLKKLAATR